MKLPLWSLIPALMLLTLFYFQIFDNYTVQEWILGNGIIGLGIGIIYISEGVYKKIKCHQ